MQEAQKMQMQLQKDQKELENTIYEGVSSNVNVKMNGKFEILDVKINIDDISSDDKEMLEDMVMIAVNDAIKKMEADKQEKFGKYGNMLNGLM